MHAHDDRDLTRANFCFCFDVIAPVNDDLMGFYSMKLVYIRNDDDNLVGFDSWCKVNVGVSE